MLIKALQCPSKDKACNVFCQEKKKPGDESETFILMRVGRGIRTLDLQNHNLTR